MIDINVETIISLAEAASFLPRRRAGKKPHVSCIYRWTTQGCRGVRLESVQIGGTRCTSREALSRFFERLSGTIADNANPTRMLSAPSRLAKAERQLDELLR